METNVRNSTITAIHSSIAASSLIFFIIHGVPVLPPFCASTPFIILAAITNVSNEFALLF
jgi:hypothetical protein